MDQIEDQIEDHNGIVIGPMTTLEQGFSALYEQQPDACILNIRLGPDMVYELAERINDEGIPFIFSSSERREDIPDRFNAVPLHSKPIDLIQAAAWLLEQAKTTTGQYCSLAAHARSVRS